MGYIKKSVNKIIEDKNKRKLKQKNRVVPRTGFVPIKLTNYYYYYYYYTIKEQVFNVKNIAI